jgi:hypothetical protein
MNRRVSEAVAVFALLLGIALATVWASDQGPGQRGPKGPPLEALEACKGKSEGAEVQFEGMRGAKVEATCKTIGGQLVAVPKGGPPGQNMSPPGRSQSRQ